MNTKAYKKCEYIIRQFMALDNPSAELTANFHQWLCTDRHCREKNHIFHQLFIEALSGDDNASKHNSIDPPTKPHSICPNESTLYDRDKL